MKKEKISHSGTAAQRINENDKQQRRASVPPCDDIIVILLCFIGALLCAMLFYRDLNATFSRYDQQPVGTISFRYNTAQRRFIDRVVWDRLKNESPVYNGDVIRTADLSEATITFDHGDIIILSSNTLVQVFVSSEGSRIDLSGGGVSVNTSVSGTSTGLGSSVNRTLIISAGEKTITVESGAVMRAISNEGGGLDLAVIEGNVVLQTSNADTPLSLEAGTGLQLTAAGQTLTLPQAVATAPAPGARFFTLTNEGTAVTFNWNTNNYNAETQTRLEIASDRSFNRIYLSQDFNTNTFTLNLPAGDWFWRLYPASNTTRDIPYSRLSIVYSPHPTPINPTAGQTITYKIGNPNVRFQWTASAQAQSYTLEAADNPAMNNPTLSVQVRGTSNVITYNTTALTRGTWHWRVTPNYSRDFTNNNTANSSLLTAHFIIERNAELSAPVPTAPENNAILNIEIGRRDILFTWRKETEARSYTIRISANSNMANPVIEQTVTETFFRYASNAATLTAGTYYWTVTYTDSEGDASPASNPRTFNAMQGEIIQRPVFPADNYTIAFNFLPDTRFTWKTNLTGTRFQVSADERFTTLLIDEAANGEAYTIRSLQNGAYYWRITGSAGTQTLQTAPRKFTVTHAIPAPVLRLPEGMTATRDGRIILAENQTLEFNWQPSAGAEYYTFKLFRGNNEAQSINESTIYGTSHSINMDNYEEGNYTWQVQGFARETPTSTRRTGLSATQTINIIYLRPVTLVSPRSGFEFLGLNASRNPAAMQWASVVTPVNVELIIARNAQMTDIVFRRTAAPFNLTMPRLTAGDYYWTVRAQTEEGLDISAPAPNRFKVLPIPLLPVPQNRTPANGFTVTVSMLRQSRALDFSWNRVQGANGYILTVYKDVAHPAGAATRQKILETTVLTQTNYKIEDLQILGRGNFLWQIEAVYVFSEGFIEQRGQLQDNRLILDIPAPAPVEPNQTGELYAR